MLAEKERVPVQLRSSVRYANYYPGFGIDAEQQDYDILLINGWLGDHTMDLQCAPYLASHGFNVSTIYPNKPHAPEFNLQSSLDAHAAAKVHAQKAKEKGVAEQNRPIIVVNHSRANVAGISLAEYSATAVSDYKIAAILSVAGVGLNGRPVGPRQIIAQMYHSGRLLRDRFPDAFQVYATSFDNFIKNIPLSILRGVHAGRANLSGKAMKLRSNGLYMPEWYGSGDGLIREPLHRTDYDVYEGDHMLPIVEPEIVYEAIIKTIAYLRSREDTAA